METSIEQRIASVRTEVKSIEDDLTRLEGCVETLKPYLNVIQGPIPPPLPGPTRNADLAIIMARLDKHEETIRLLRDRQISDGTRTAIPVRTMEEELEKGQAKKLAREQAILKPRGRTTWITFLGIAIATIGAYIMVAPNSVGIYRPLGNLPVFVAIVGFALITIDLWRGRTAPRTPRPAAKVRPVREGVPVELRTALKGLKEKKENVPATESLESLL